MATHFKILEEAGIEDQKRGKENIRPHAKREQANRAALQNVNGAISQAPKRLKTATGGYDNEEKVVQKQEKVVVETTTKPEEFTEVELCKIQTVAENKYGRRVVGDLQYNTEYLRDIWSYMVNKEKCVVWPVPSYMTKQPHINNGMRSLLVDWLATIVEEYKLSEQTLHLCVNYIDRFLSQMAVVKSKLQLLGCAALLVAGKVEEVYPPNVEEWAYLSNNTYSCQQIKKMEQLLLKILKFELQPPTMVSFIQHLCTEFKLDNETMYLAMYLSELILLESDDYLLYQPSKLAVASVALARCTLSKRKPWPKQLEAASGYSLKQLSPVVHRQNQSFIDSPQKPQQAIQSKYKRDDYYKVAFLKPKILELDDD